MLYAEAYRLTSPHLDDGDRQLVCSIETAKTEVISALFEQHKHAPTPLTDAALRLLLRICTASRSIFILVSCATDQNELDGAANDAATLARTVGDVWIQLEYLLRGDGHRSPTSLAELYNDFIWFERLQYSKNLEHINCDLAEAIKASPKRNAGDTEIKKKCKRLKNKFTKSNGNHWYPGSLKDIAEATGRTSEWYFFCSLYNSCVHGGPMATRYGPIANAKTIMCNCMNATAASLNLCVEKFKLQINPKMMKTLGAWPNCPFNI